MVGSKCFHLWKHFVANWLDFRHWLPADFSLWFLKLSLASGHYPSRLHFHLVQWFKINVYQKMVCLLKGLFTKINCYDCMAWIFISLCSTLLHLLYTLVFFLNFKFTNFDHIKAFVQAFLSFGNGINISPLKKNKFKLKILV